MCNSAKMILKSTFFEVTTLTSNNSKNKFAEIICLSAFSLFNSVFCSSLFLTVTTAGGRKVDRKKLSRSTMTLFHLKTRSHFEKRAS